MCGRHVAGAWRKVSLGQTMNVPTHATIYAPKENKKAIILCLLVNSEHLFMHTGLQILYMYILQCLGVPEPLSVS